MTTITFFIKIKGDDTKYNIPGEDKATTKTSHCPSGSYPTGDDNYHCSKYSARLCMAHARNCFDENGYALLQNKDGTWVSKKISDIFPSASKKQIMDLGGYNYYLAVTYNNLTDTLIKNEINNELALTYKAASDDSTVFQQALFGSISPNDNIYPGTLTGFCDISDNINTKVYDTYTCSTIVQSDLVSSDIDVTREQEDYCLGSGSSDVKCACYNVSRPDAINYCTRNPRLPGCNELMANKRPLDRAGISGAWQGSTSGCLAPNACTSSGIYKPKPAPNTDCHLSVQYCKQITDLESLKNSSATVYQTCKQSLASNTGGDDPGDGLLSFWANIPLVYKIIMILLLVAGLFMLIL